MGDGVLRSAMAAFYPNAQSTSPSIVTLCAFSWVRMASYEVVGHSNIGHDRAQLEHDRKRRKDSPK
jgi:hypothetical protein